MKIFKIILTAAILLLSSTLAFGQTKPKKVEGSLTFVNNIPLPLGRYVQLAKPTVDFTISEPDADNNGVITLWFEFEILRHVPNLGWVDLRLDRNAPIDMKFEDDANARKSLVEAVRNSRLTTVTIPVNINYWDKVAWELRQLNGKELSFEYSKFEIPIPISAISITGYDSQNSQIEDAWLRVISEGKFIYFVAVLSFNKLSNDCYPYQLAHPIEFIKIQTSNNNSLKFYPEDRNLYRIDGRFLDELLSSSIQNFIVSNKKP